MKYRWPVAGVTKKLKDSDFVNTILQFDICILLETWCSESFIIPNRYVYSKKAKKLKGKKGRYSGVRRYSYYYEK